jgi:hypothetical protein
LHKEFLKRVHKVTSCDELSDYIQKWLQSFGKNFLQQVYHLEVSFTCHNNLEEITQEFCASWKLFKPTNASHLIKIRVEPVKICRSKSCFSSVKIKHLHESMVLALFHLSFFSGLLFLFFFFLEVHQFLDEILSEANTRH